MTGSGSVGCIKRGACKWLQATNSVSPVASTRIDMADTRRIDMRARLPEAVLG